MSTEKASTPNKRILVQSMGPAEINRFMQTGLSAGNTSNGTMPITSAAPSQRKQRAGSNQDPLEDPYDDPLSRMVFPLPKNQNMIVSSHNDLRSQRPRNQTENFFSTGGSFNAMNVKSQTHYGNQWNATVDNSIVGIKPLKNRRSTTNTIV